MSGGAPGGDAPSDEALVNFVYHEAWLLDQKRHEEWYALFTDDGLYWMPLTRDQTEGRLSTSLFYEDKLLLRVRINRLSNPNSFSQSQPSWCQHVLQAPRIEVRDAVNRRYELYTPFIYVESQHDHQEVYAGVVRHHLVQIGGQLRMRVKRVELLNCGAALPSMQLFP